jgi:hypothetical protein
LNKQGVAAAHLAQDGVFAAIEALTYAHFWRKGTFFASGS